MARKDIYIHMGRDALNAPKYDIVQSKKFGVDQFALFKNNHFVEMFTSRAAAEVARKADQEKAK